MVIKISIPDDEFEEVKSLAQNEKMTVQDYFRYKTLGKKNPIIFEPEEAFRRAISKYQKGDIFTLPDVYGEEWSLLDPRMCGVFGKRFFNFVDPKTEIEFSGMSKNGRRATYTIK